MYTETPLTYAETLEELKREVANHLGEVDELREVIADLEATRPDACDCDECQEEPSTNPFDADLALEVAEDIVRATQLSLTRLTDIVQDGNTEDALPAASTVLTFMLELTRLSLDG